MELPSGTPAGDLELDQAGNLHIATNPGISKLLETLIPWSSVAAYDFSLAPDGSGYGAGRSTCKCVYSIQSDGTFSTLYGDASAWSYVALTTDGKLYANVPAGSGKGLYLMDRSTGAPMVVISGGPGPGGDGSWYGMASASDGTLYALGSLDGSAAGSRLYRLDGTQVTAVAGPFPHGGFGLALGQSGTFYVSSNFTAGGGYGAGEILVVDPALGSITLLASTTGRDTGIGGMAYNSVTRTLYVIESGKLWALTHDATPTRDKSWGAVKALYRGDRLVD